MMFHTYDLDNDDYYSYSDDDNDASNGSSAQEMQLHMYEDDDSSEDIETQLTSLRRRKSKSKQRRSNATAETTSSTSTTHIQQNTTTTTTTPKQKTVQFGTVECKTYPVTLSACTLPRSGGPPVGIDYSEEPITTLSCTIETYESLYPNRRKEKQLRLSSGERCDMLLSLAPGDEGYYDDHQNMLHNVTSSLHHKLSIQPTSSYSPPSPPRMRKSLSFSSFSFHRGHFPTQQRSSSKDNKRQPWINQEYMQQKGGRGGAAAAGFKRKRSRVTDVVLSLLRMSPKRARKERFGTF